MSERQPRAEVLAEMFGGIAVGLFLWVSGNTGCPHMRHLIPCILTFDPEECHRAEPRSQTLRPVNLLSSLKSLTFRTEPPPAARNA